MPKQRADRSASLVVRAFVDESHSRLIVRVVEVDAAGEDRLVGATVSSADALRIVGGWLDSLVSGSGLPDAAGRDGESNGRVTAS